jgi:PAS domain S-box-containing protein
MPTDDSLSSAAGVSRASISSDLFTALTEIQQQLAHWRGLAQQAGEQLRLALELGRLGTWDWHIAENQVIRTGHEQLFGLASGSFPGTYESFLACVHPEDREPVEEEVARCLTSRQEYRQEYRVVWPDGSVHWIEGRARFHCDEFGNPVRMLGVVQEITHRKLIEQHKARFGALFEAAQDAVLIADDDRRYIDANPAACELLGLPPEQLRGRRVEEFVEEVRGVDVRQAWQHFQTAGVQRGECRIRRADGTLFEVEYSAKTNFSPGLHLSILRDVTERKRAEQALARQAAELRRSNADLQDFAYVTSHDLQEPLRTIASFAQLLGQRYHDRLDEQANEFIDYIVSGVHRMKTLIDALLHYSQVVNGEPAPLLPVRLADVVHAATMNLQGVIEESHSRVTYGELPTVRGSHLQLVQLFQNLIGNAIKYRGADAPEVSINAESHGGEWIISVRDNGIGISREHLDRIFGVFKRLHGREIPGTGIGLAICRRIVERHGGRIWVESAPGAGSTFYFTLPNGPS